MGIQNPRGLKGRHVVRMMVAAGMLGVLCWPHFSLARPGGGEHYSGGSTHGGSGGGGDFFDLIFLLFNLIELLIDSPVIGVLVLLFLTAVGTYAYLKNPERTTRKAVARLTPSGRGGSTGEGDGEEIPGLAALRGRDPGLARAGIEARATLLFWKWIEARSRPAPEGPDCLRPFATVPPEDLLGVGRDALFYQVAVSSTVLLACDAAPDGLLERSYVRLKWSAARDSESKPVALVDVLTLARRVGAAAGPGEHEWGLESVASPQEAQRLRTSRLPAGAAAPPPEDALDLPDLSDPHEREALLFLMARVFAADGQITDGERKMLRRCARRWSVPDERLEAALQAGTDAQNLTAIQEADRLPFLAGLVDAALLDGRVDARERKLLTQIAQSLSLPPDSVDDLIRARKRAT